MPNAKPIKLNMPHMIASRSEEHTSELQSQFRISYAVFCLKKKKKKQQQKKQKKKRKKKRKKIETHERLQNKQK